MDISVKLADIDLEHPLMNAAGTCKTPDEVEDLSGSPTAAVMVGSITMEARLGNSGNTYWSGPRGSLNSLGLPNPGFSGYEQYLPTMVACAHKAEKPLFVSVAGFSPQEYAVLAALAFDSGADLVELNLGCPNVWEDGEQKPIASFRSQLVAEILQTVQERVGVDAKVAVKISPFSDPLALEEVIKVIGSSEMVRVVTAVNTFPNAYGEDEQGRSRITPSSGLAGFAGPGLKAIALGQIRQIRKLLPEQIQIIGVGGIDSGADIEEYLSSGAAVVQVATAFMDRGAKVFDELLTELVEGRNT